MGSTNSNVLVLRNFKVSFPIFAYQLNIHLVKVVLKTQLYCNNLKRKRGIKTTLFLGTFMVILKLLNLPISFRGRGILQKSSTLVKRVCTHFQVIWRINLSASSHLIGLQRLLTRIQNNPYQNKIKFISCHCQRQNVGLLNSVQLV